MLSELHAARRPGGAVANRFLRTALAPVAAVIIALTGLRAHAGCDNFDYSGEFVVTNVQLTSQTPFPPSLVELEFTAELHNTAGSTLDDAVASPDFGASAQDVLPGDADAQSWQFGTVTAFATEPNTTGGTLRVTVPADQADALVQELTGGELPVRVTGSERLVLKPNVYVLPWTEFADGNFDTVGAIGIHNPLYLFQTFPFEDAAALGQLNWSVELSGGLGANICVGAPGVGDQFYVYEGPGSGAVDTPGAISEEWFPQVLRHARLERFVFESSAATAQDCAAAADGATPGLMLQLNPPNTWDILSTVERGTFCTSEQIYLDQPVAQTRFLVDHPGHEAPLDDDPAVRERDTQPVRLDDVAVGDVRVNGQIQGYALRPSIAVRVKPAGVEVRTSIESDLSMALQVTADATVTALDETGLQLATLCFPLPPVPLGFATLESSLELSHTLDVSATMEAGATLGIQKQFHGGYYMGWDPARPAGQKFYSETRFTERPLALTPPRLVTDLAADARVATHFRAELNLASSLCGFGGPWVQATLAGNVHVSPLETPWWTLGHDAELSAGLSFDLFGFSLLERSAPVVSFPGSESLSAPAARATTSPSAGNDQRWAVDVHQLNNNSGTALVADVAATGDGGAVAVSGAGTSGGAERVLRFDAEGQLLWDLQYATVGTRVEDVTVAGTDIVTAGDRTNGSAMWAARHDAAGGELWSKELTLTNADGDACLLSELLHVTDATNGAGLLLAGNSGSTLTNSTRPCLLRLADDGTPLWSRVAGEVVDPAGDVTADWTLYDAIATRDDGILIVGSLNLHPTLDFPTTKPIVTKLDSDGNPVWQRLFAVPDETRRTGAFKAVTQAGDGSFYMTGSIGGTVLETGSMLVARLSEDGQEGKGAILYYALEPQGSLEDSNDIMSHWSTNDVLAEGPYDTGLDIVAVEGGAVLSGVLSTNWEAWLIRLNEHLGVEWFTRYDGRFSDQFTSLAVTDSGIFAAGPTQATYPSSIISGRKTFMLMKLPFEGLIDGWHDEMAMYRGYVLPTVWQGPAYYQESPIIQPEEGTTPFPMLAGTVTDQGGYAPLLMTPNPVCAQILTATSGTPSPAYVCDEDGDGVEELFDNCPDTANPDQADADGDGIGNVCDEDQDGDGVDDTADNCTLIANPDQRDSNGDGYGNHCDPDLDDNGVVNVLDLGLLRAAFFGTPAAGNWNPDADFNGDDAVNVVDLATLKAFFFAAPGPSGVAP